MLEAAIGMRDDRFHDLEMPPRLAEVMGDAQYIVGGRTEIERQVIGAIAACAAHEVKGVAQVVGEVRDELKDGVTISEEEVRGPTWKQHQLARQMIDFQKPEEMEHAVEATGHD